MWSLLLQSLVLLLAAYFVGVWIGCMARRMIAPPKGRVDDRQVAPVASPQPVKAATPAPQQIPQSASEAPAAPPVAAAPSPASADPALQAAAAASAAAATAVAAQTVTAAPSPEPNPSPTPAPAAPAPVAAAPAPSVAQQMETIGTDVDPVAARSHIKPEPFPEGQLPAAVGGGADSASTVATAVAPTEDAAAPAAQPSMPQDLTAIRGIDAATAVVLEREGVTRYEQLSAWNEGDVARINRALGGMRRVQEENWIEQASVLAGGGLTSFARRRKVSTAAGGPGAAQIVQPSADQGSAVSLASSSPAVAAPIAAALVDVAPTNGSTVSADVMGDDLTAVDGITPEIARTLKEQGINRYAQLARLDEAGANRLNGLLGIKDRVQSQGWVAQAAGLAGIAVAAASVDASPAALTASPVSVDAAPSDTAGATDANDNLKRIRGIGELIERKLYDMGYVTYAAIANWTEHDVRHVSQALDFRGRIERENWIEQARILATGGQTEFSRRFDTGA